MWSTERVRPFSVLKGKVSETREPITLRGLPAVVPEKPGCIVGNPDVGRLPPSVVWTSCFPLMVRGRGPLGCTSHSCFWIWVTDHAVAGGPSVRSQPNMCVCGVSQVVVRARRVFGPGAAWKYVFRPIIGLWSQRRHQCSHFMSS